MLARDRQNSVIYLAGEWTVDKLRNLAGPVGSPRFSVIYYSTATATGRAQSGWVSTSLTTAADYVLAQGWTMSRIAAVVYQKPTFKAKTAKK